MQKLSAIPAINIARQIHINFRLSIKERMTRAIEQKKFCTKC